MGLVEERLPVETKTKPSLVERIESNGRLIVDGGDFDLSSVVQVHSEVIRVVPKKPVNVNTLWYNLGSKKALERAEQLGARYVFLDSIETDVRAIEEGVLKYLAVFYMRKE